MDDGGDKEEADIENLLTDASKPNACRLVHHVYDGTVEQARTSKDNSEEAKLWYRLTQSLLVVLGVAATVVVAIGNRVPSWAPWAIIPTALISLLTGLSYVFDQQGRFIRTTAVKADLQQLAGEIIRDANIAVDCDATQPSQVSGKISGSAEPVCAKIDLDRAKAWDAKLTEILRSNINEFLESEGNKAPTPPP